MLSEEYGKRKDESDRWKKEERQQIIVHRIYAITVAE